jgi:DNA-binding NarL/FixJ family response regulator
MVNSKMRMSCNYPGRFGNLCYWRTSLKEDDEMVVIATRDLELAQRLNTAIEGRKALLTQALEPIELRHRVHQVQPEVVVLDVRFGGNLYRVIEQTPGIMLANSGPAVILLLPWQSDEVVDEAARQGCFDAISLSHPSFDAEVSRSVLDAKAARLSGALERLQRPARGSLH